MRAVLVAAAAALVVATTADAGTVVLFDNMNRAAGPVTYDCCHSYSIQGPQVAGGTATYTNIAVAFTPQVNASVTEIDAPVSYWSGFNGITLGLYTDDHDRPGRMIRQWVFHNLPAFHTCCSFLAATWPNGIPVVAGRQYWVVVQTDGTMLDTYALWNQNLTTTAQGHVERWCVDSQLPGGIVCAPQFMSGTWGLVLGSITPALAIIGKN